MDREKGIGSSSCSKMSGRGNDDGGGRGGTGGRGGKGRKSKVKGRGSGNRRFVTSAEDLAQRDVVESQRQEARRVRRQDSDDEGDDKGKDDDDEKDLTFEEANEEVEERVIKAKGVSGLISTQNPNAKSNATKNIKVGAISTTFVEQKLSRREREAIEKAKSSAAYLKRHLAGETDQAKKDISRLADVKKRRDDADKRRGEEEEGEKLKDK